MKFFLANICSSLFIFLDLNSWFLMGLCLSNTNLMVMKLAMDILMTLQKNLIPRYLTTWGQVTSGNSSNLTIFYEFLNVRKNSLGLSTERLRFCSVKVALPYLLKCLKRYSEWVQSCWKYLIEFLNFKALKWLATDKSTSIFSKYLHHGWRKVWILMLWNGLK